MNEEKVELIFRFLPRKLVIHQFHGLMAAARHARPNDKIDNQDVKWILGTLIDSGRIDLLRSDHHDTESEVSVFVSLAEFRIIMTDPLNHHGTLVATGGYELDLLSRPELLVTNFARHSHEKWAIDLQRQGLPTCVVINGHGENRRPTKHPRKKHGISLG